MSTEQNKVIVRQFVEEAQSQGNLGAIDEFMIPEFVDHSAFPGFSPNREGVRQLFGALRAAFPDLQAIIHDQVAEGDKVVTRKTLHGTHQGEFMGIPPTGKQVAFGIIDILRLADSQLTDHWCEIDLLGLLQQLDAMPGRN